jgi:proteasome lid subunit RPN8/RPN11
MTRNGQERESSAARYDAMTEVSSRPDDPIDIRTLARQDLPHEAFPGGRNERFRVFFSPEVHAALWKHANADTTVEICGVLVGSWHRDDVGPFVKIIESIRGEGAETRFAEVTFTHQTWAKINAEMDTKFAHLSIVGWYHTHPDFGIFLSDRDRFIQEHFFSGPGQVAHVIDPIRGSEGVFVWRDGKPSLGEHFWAGDRVVVGAAEPAADSRPRLSEQRAAAAASGSSGPGALSGPVQGRLFPSPARVVLYGAAFLLGYLLANVFSAWEHQRFVANVLASNGFVAVLRLGLSDELDRLRGDLAATVGQLDAVKSKSEQDVESLVEIRGRIASAAQRVGAIKARYGNTLAEDDMLRRLFRDKVASMAQAPTADAQAVPETKPNDPLPSGSANR